MDIDLKPMVGMVTAVIMAAVLLSILGAAPQVGAGTPTQAQFTRIVFKFA